MKKNKLVLFRQNATGKNVNDKQKNPKNRALTSSLPASVGRRKNSGLIGYCNTFFRNSPSGLDVSMTIRSEELVRVGMPKRSLMPLNGRRLPGRIDRDLGTKIVKNAKQLPVVG